MRLFFFGLSQGCGCSRLFLPKQYVRLGSPYQPRVNPLLDDFSHRSLVINSGFHDDILFFFLWKNYMTIWPKFGEKQISFKYNRKYQSFHWKWSWLLVGFLPFHHHDDCFPFSIPPLWHWTMYIGSWVCSSREHESIKLNTIRLLLGCPCLVKCFDNFVFQFAMDWYLDTRTRLFGFSCLSFNYEYKGIFANVEH